MKEGSSNGISRIRFNANIAKAIFAALVAKVNKKIAEGYDVINLGQGNPDQPTFDYIIEGLKEAAERPINNKYSQFRGQPTFKKACAAFYQENTASNSTAKKKSAFSAVQKSGWSNCRGL